MTAGVVTTVDPATTTSGRSTCIEYVSDVPCTVLTIYETPIFVGEAAKDTIPSHILKTIRKEIEDDDS